MRRLVNALIGIVLLVLVGGVVVAAIPRMKDAADRSACKNNLRQIGVGLNSVLDAEGKYPAGTIPNESLPCAKRLSWMVPSLCYIEQLPVRTDRSKAWDDEDNLNLKVYDRESDDYTLPLGEVKPFRCPASTATGNPRWPSLTSYVGVAGVGADAAEYDEGYPGGGVFGCNRRIRIANIEDGTSLTLLVIETGRDNGPWTAGGRPTVRALDPNGGPYLGRDGQFSSGHRSGGLCSSPIVTQAVFADGSVRGFTASTDPESFEALATIAGGELPAMCGDD